MEFWKPLLLFAAGVVSGWINVMAGGGSIISVPVMVFLGLPGPVANGTNRIGIIAQNVMAVWGFFRKGFSDFKLSASLAACASLGAFFGANAGVRLEGAWFERTLAMIMIGVLIISMTGFGQKRVSPEDKPKNLLLGHLLFVGAGFWGGFIQIGVGLIQLPILNRVMGLDLVRANMHKVFIALVFSFVSLAVFAAQVEIEWELGLALGLGYALGGWLGAHSAVSRGEGLIRKVFYLALVAMAVKLLFF
ncbi:sulfite exporter TauE/SafE family protein [Hyphococcus luteus]|uniref:Probable membrane transporter protein n=1 Tax=Hyphococcus luteus TaxID=2058213 RepID=A0A2S7JZF4_9PROT|nr:sulfite exporter TauE/SafE family protein [Marinicaulis flavus]PQA85596.1 sulfite exporter TauE/SafE family protein [Marinicaulis flavus]